MSDIPSLPTDRLSVVIFGPGFGESVVVRAPPGEWLVVDSLLDREPQSHRNPASRLLSEYGARATAVVLTHPHDDHAAGFDRLIARAPDARVGCVPIHLSSHRDRLTDADAARALRAGSAEHALAAILDAWERSPARQWRLGPRARAAVGDATVTALGPDQASSAAAADRPSWKAWSAGGSEATTSFWPTTHLLQPRETHGSC